MTDLAGHPIESVERLAAEKPGIRAFELGVYIYSPQKVKDNRRVVVVQAKRLREEYCRLLECLKPGEEIAFQSRVYLGEERRGTVRHVPLVDFACKPEDERVVSAVGACNELGIGRMSLYASGRSLHGYAESLVTEREWARLLGRLLLENRRHDDEVIDSRWVGHRLLAGYGALRWSNSSGMYAATPTRFRLAEEE
ncbi:MAG: hypothetical protein GY719_04905 [bacterium]|nr:hypothetical protein [bacterium]